MSLVAIVLTLNEERHLPDCLTSLAQLTDAVIVVDSGSTDRTREVAESAGARVEVRPFDGYANQRNAALEMSAGADWVLFLDADERLTQSGADEIRFRTDAADSDTAAFWLPRCNRFFGRTLRGGGWWPDYQARVLRPNRCRYDPARQVHEVVLIDGASEYLTEPIVHVNYESRREFLLKQRAYTLQRVKRDAISGSAPRRRSYLSAPVREFRRRYVDHQGYRDGLTGLFLASVLALEEVRACRLLRLRASS